MSSIKTFQCPNCGSTVTTTGAEKEAQCAYCGSTVIVPDELREAPQPQPMQYNFGPTSQPNTPTFQNMVTADKVAKATIGFTAVEFHPPRCPDLRYSCGGWRDFVLCVFKYEFGS